MWISFTILSALLLLVIGFLVREYRELLSISAELKDQFKKLSATDIQPQPNWPKWARKIYDTWYSEYRSTFNWCAYRVQSLVCSCYTIAVLEEKFQFLRSEQEKIQYLLQDIEKYAKVPEMKIQTQKRLETLYERVGQLPGNSSLHPRYRFMETRLSEMQTDNCDKYPDIHRSLESLHWFMDILEEDLNKENVLRVA
jgi:hypothetical protein